MSLLEMFYYFQLTKHEQLHTKIYITVNLNSIYIKTEYSFRKTTYYLQNRLEGLHKSQTNILTLGDKSAHSQCAHFAQTIHLIHFSFEREFVKRYVILETHILCRFRRTRTKI